MKPILYAMSGSIGSGKTTFARRVADEKKAVFFSIDQYIKMLRQPIKNLEDYDRYYFGVRDVIADATFKILSTGASVVLDFGGTAGHWSWLKPLADSAKAEVEIYHLIVALETRRERVLNRNNQKDALFQFTDKEFDEMPTESDVPTAQAGLKIIVVKG